MRPFVCKRPGARTQRVVFAAWSNVYAFSSQSKPWSAEAFPPVENILQVSFPLFLCLVPSSPFSHFRDESSIHHSPRFFRKILARFFNAAPFFFTVVTALFSRKRYSSSNSVRSHGSASSQMSHLPARISGELCCNSGRFLFGCRRISNRQAIGIR